MNPQVLFLITIIISLSAGALAQSRPGISLDLRTAFSSHNEEESATSRTSSPSPSADASRSGAARRLEREVFAMLNAERDKKGLNGLEWSEQVAAVARIHSQNMADEKFFSHRGSDGSMVDDRADRVGLGSWRSIGENIAYVRGFEDPASTAVEKWIESTAHRKNLLDPNWTESAVGVVITTDGTYYLTQVFVRK